MDLDVVLHYNVLLRVMATTITTSLRAAHNAGADATTAAA